MALLPGEVNQHVPNVVAKRRRGALAVRGEYRGHVFDVVVKVDKGVEPAGPLRGPDAAPRGHILHGDEPGAEQLVVVRCDVLVVAERSVEHLGQRAVAEVLLDPPAGQVDRPHGCRRIRTQHPLEQKLAPGCGGRRDVEGARLLEPVQLHGVVRGGGAVAERGD